MQVGYYVDNTYFGLKKYQAIACANNRAKVFGRAIPMTFVDHFGHINNLMSSIAASPIPADTKVIDCGMLDTTSSWDQFIKNHNSKV